MVLRVENCRQIVTQQLQKSFSTMSFSTILFNYAIQLLFNYAIHLKTDIALIASRFVRYRFSGAI